MAWQNVTVGITLVHSDLRAFRFSARDHALDGVSLKAQLLYSALRQLEELFGHDFVLPAFNYDFTSTRRFDVRLDLPQIGALPRSVMTLPGWNRSKTPVFSFLAQHRMLRTDEKPFSSDSVLGQLLTNSGQVALLGVGFESFTFLHHLEFLANSPYRYEKKFTGQRVEDGRVEACEVSFHVRPFGLDIDYDFDKIGSVVLGQKAAKKQDSHTTVVSVAEASEVLLGLLSKDPFFLLDSNSRAAVKDNLDRLGRPFELGDFE